jgi:hypothetical protein
MHKKESDIDESKRHFIDVNNRVGNRFLCNTRISLPRGWCKSEG